MTTATTVLVIVLSPLLAAMAAERAAALPVAVAALSARASEGSPAATRMRAVSAR